MTRTVRRPAVAGTFYDHRPDVLRAAVRGYLDAVAGGRGSGDEPASPPKAVIAPHAGHIYSGPVAAHAYAALAPRRGEVERVVLIGPAHRVPVDGIAVPSVDAFATPLGDVEIDAAARAALLGLPFVHVDDRAHAPEHCLEVHLPFVIETLGDVTIVPLLAGRATPDAVADALDTVWGGDETAIVVSTDLSHYYDDDTARRLDARTAAAIVTRDVGAIAADDACGAVAVRGALELARRRALDCRLLDLRTSADTAGPPDSVVGYGAFRLG